MSFSEEEIERYARHIVLREIGGAGQAKLSKAKILSIGAGGLSSPLLMYLAAAGIGTLGVIDDDRVSLSNLQRQIAHSSDRIDALKTESAAQTITALNPHVIVKPYPERLTRENAREIIAGYDMICDGCDNFDTRYLVNQTCVETSTPLISGAIGQWDGQVSIFSPARSGPCYSCIFPEAPREGLAPSCAEGGVVGALPGVIGSLMAMEAIKLITGAGQPLIGRLLIYDALDAQMRVMKLTARKDCAVCGGTP